MGAALDEAAAQVRADEARGARHDHGRAVQGAVGNGTGGGRPVTHFGITSTENLLAA